MTITKRPAPQKQEAAIEAFIAGAPDAPAQEPEPKPSKPAKVMINIQMPADLLARVDEKASELSLTRSGFIKLMLTRAVQAENN
jgi:hypothetical protein